MIYFINRQLGIIVKYLFIFSIYDIYLNIIYNL